MQKPYPIQFSLIVTLLCLPVLLISQTSINGKVIDEDSGTPLFGANLIIEGTGEGTTTKKDGTFTLTSTEALPWVIKISYTGYESQTLKIDESINDLIVNLKETFILGQEIVISASRKQEKIQDAPASISIISERKMEASPNNNPLRNLINEPGAMVQQQSAGRINVHLRGDDGLVYGTASYPMLDYMPLALPGDLFLNLGSALNNIDIERIEVVRGPGSALYGPGVTAGVIHFLSKSSIDKPGTTLELLGGELSTYGLSIRHATKVSDKFGFKLNAYHQGGDEFTLDPDDPDDALQISRLQNTVSVPAVTSEIQDPTLPARPLLGPDDLDPDGDGNPMQNFWRSSHVNATLEFRPDEEFTLFASGGIGSLSTVFYNASGEGLAQGIEYWAQARIQKGGLFGQIAYRVVDGSSEKNPSWLYQTGFLTPQFQKWLESQVQYNFETPKLLNAQWTAGMDHRSILTDSQNLLYGRFENDDDYRITGGYIQSKLELNPKFDLVLAGRLDRFSFLNETSFSPRAVIVYKPNTKHTFRVGFNRAVGSPTPVEINPDFPLVTIIPGKYDIWYLGNKNPQTFGNDPQIVFNGVLPFPSLPVGTPGLPLAYVQGAVSTDVITALADGLSSDPLLAPLVPSISEYLSNPANFVGGTGGTFAGINLFNNLPLELLDAPSASLRTEDTWEFGYKGLYGDKLAVSIDLYHRNIDGLALYTAISPSYTLLNADEIPAALGNAIEDNVSSFLTDLLSPFVGTTLPDEATLIATVNQLSGIIGGAYEQGGTGFIEAIQGLIDGAILASTPTEQVPNNGVTHVAAGFRTFEPFGYWGTDIGLNYYVNDDFTLFGNFSWISESLFNPQIVGVDGSESVTILQPSYRFRLGSNFTPKSGIRVNLAYQYDPSYNVLLGQYTGDTDVKSLFDIGVGYKFKNGLILGISAQNLFNNEYRTYPNFPKIGRRILGKITYTFGDR